MLRARCASIRRSPRRSRRIQPGDQLWARGAKNADGTAISADGIVSGSFRSIAGTILSIDNAASTLTVKDLATKKPVTIRISADAQMRRLDDRVAAFLAARLKGGQGGGQGSGAGRRRPGGAHGGCGGAQRSFSQSGGGGAGRMDFETVLERAPVIQLASLQKGEAVMIVATEDGSGVSAVKLLAGVEPLLEAPQAQDLLSNWSLSSGDSEAAASNFIIFSFIRKRGNFAFKIEIPDSFYRCHIDRVFWHCCAGASCTCGCRSSNTRSTIAVESDSDESARTRYFSDGIIADTSIRLADRASVNGNAARAHSRSHGRADSRRGRDGINSRRQEGGSTTADSAGGYQVHGIPAGSYVIEADFEGFAPFVSAPISLNAGQTKNIDIKMAIEAAQQEVVVTDEGSPRSARRPARTRTRSCSRAATSTRFRTIPMSCRAN